MLGDVVFDAEKERTKPGLLRLQPEYDFRHSRGIRSKHIAYTAIPSDRGLLRGINAIDRECFKKTRINEKRLISVAGWKAYSHLVGRVPA